MQRVALLSMHTSPLAQPGVGDGGGMNVYVREIASALARLGVEVTTYTRAWKPGLPSVVVREPNNTLVHVEAGDYDVEKGDLPQLVDVFTAEVRRHLVSSEPHVIHANYWLSGLAGHALKHDLGLPLVTTFHTLARVKSLFGDDESPERDGGEVAVMGCSDTVVVSCAEERDQLRMLYPQWTGAADIVAPGVEHAVFAPGDVRGARSAIGLDDSPVVLFVGRIQPLKGVDLAIRAVAALGRSDVQLVVVGGASGPDGAREVADVRSLVERLGMSARVHHVDPMPHHLLSTYFRAADVVVVPSRSESFGLVALEAMASGRPVVASAVGGLLSLVDDGATGVLVTDREVNSFAHALRRVIDSPALARDMGAAAHDRSRRYTWNSAAMRLRRIYAEVSARTPVTCS